jgi:hypothetical protein
MTASVISESDRAPLPASYRDEPRHLAALAVAHSSSSSAPISPGTSPRVARIPAVPA